MKLEKILFLPLILMALFENIVAQNLEIKYLLPTDSASSQQFIRANEIDTTKIVLPHIIKSVKPAFPEIAKKAGVNGTVIIRAWIDKDGKVGNAVVYRSDADLFNKSTIDAVKQWIFTQIRENNVVIPTWIEIPFIYKSNGEILFPQ